MGKLGLLFVASDEEHARRPFHSPPDRAVKIEARGSWSKGSFLPHTTREIYVSRRERTD